MSYLRLAVAHLCRVVSENVRIVRISTPIVIIMIVETGLKAMRLVLRTGIHFENL